jgi:uncharacterized flavoprotein (TIGR03862 family)
MPATLQPRIAIIGGGPAGLMAAEEIVSALPNAQVTIYERKTTVGRKFMMAGHGGLNITHSEPPEQFLQRYETASSFLRPIIEQFTPQHMQAWCATLGEPTFIGSSGRVFPKSFKASPLLRAWIKRLNGQGVHFVLQHELQTLQQTHEGWQLGLHDVKSASQYTITANAVVLAMGGASWPHLGADGGWQQILAQMDVAVSPLQPANCGFIVPWSDYYISRYAGQPIKSIRVTVGDLSSTSEMMITKNGLEGGGIYALSARLRTQIAQQGQAVLQLDLCPNLSLDQLEQKLLARPRGALSFSSWIKKALPALTPQLISLLREPACLRAQDIAQLDTTQLARTLKALAIKLTATAGLARSISTAGGISLQELNNHLMLKKHHGLFAAGEMLDWEAPTGGYLLQACFATGKQAGAGVVSYLKKQDNLS